MSKKIYTGHELPENTDQFKEGDLFICTSTRIVYEFQIINKKIYTKQEIINKTDRKFIETSRGSINCCYNYCTL